MLTAQTLDILMLSTKLVGSEQCHLWKEGLLCCLAHAALYCLLWGNVANTGEGS